MDVIAEGVTKILLDAQSTLIAHAAALRHAHAADFCSFFLDNLLVKSFECILV